jgi:hypothetical protein
MRFEADPIGPDLQVSGRPRHYELPERITQRLLLSGVPIPPVFQRAAHELAPVREVE